MFFLGDGNNGRYGNDGSGDEHGRTRIGESIILRRENDYSLLGVGGKGYIPFHEHAFDGFL